MSDAPTPDPSPTDPGLDPAEVEPTDNSSAAPVDPDRVRGVEAADVDEDVATGEANPS